LTEISLARQPIGEEMGMQEEARRGRGGKKCVFKERHSSFPHFALKIQIIIIEVLLTST